MEAFASKGQAAERAVGLFRRGLQHGDFWPAADVLMTKLDVREHLAGKDLACWCPDGSPCHATVLLEIANGWDQP